MDTAFQPGPPSRALTGTRLSCFTGESGGVGGSSVVRAGRGFVRSRGSIRSSAVLTSTVRTGGTGDRRTSRPGDSPRVAAFLVNLESP